MAAKLVQLIPDFPDEITGAGAPNAMRILRTLVDHVASLTLAIKEIARHQDELMANMLLLDARVEGLSSKVEKHRETSQHDINLAVDGSIGEAIERAMSEREKAEYKRLVEERKRIDEKQADALVNAKYQRNGAIIAGLVILAAQLVTSYFQARGH
jgi:hypothetical protein